jgi:hypothetical protein
MVALTSATNEEMQRLSFQKGKRRHSATPQWPENILRAQSQLAILQQRTDLRVSVLGLFKMSQKTHENKSMP